MKKILIISSICSAIVIGIFFMVQYRSLRSITVDTNTVTVSPVVIDTKPVQLLFLGDIMLDRGVKRSVSNNLQGDYSALFVNTSYIASADVAFANLEGPVATGGKNVGSRFSFRMDPIVLESIKKTGIDIVSFANNHVGDYTQEAFVETLRHLDEQDIRYTGAGNNYAEASTPAVIIVRGMKIGYLAATDVGPVWLKATEKNPGVLLANDPALAQVITKAKSQVDILVVSFHFGNEYSLPSDRQILLAHSAIDSGADIVVGHHPHVMQRIEEYKGKPIFYSLGNYIFDQYFSVHTMRGMVGTVAIDPQTKKLTATSAVSSQSRQFVPQPLIPFTEKLLVTEAFTP